MYILYICVLAPLIQSGFSLIGEETDLNPLSNYEDVDDFKENFEIWDADNQADVVVYDSISRLQLAEICKKVDTLVYITQEDITIDCKAFNRGDQPIDTAKKVIKRSADEEDEGSGFGQTDSNNEEWVHTEQDNLYNTTPRPNLESEAPTAFADPKENSITEVSEPEKAVETNDQDANQPITTKSLPVEEDTANALTEQDVVQNSKPARADETNDEEITHPTIQQVVEEKTDTELTRQEEIQTISDALPESENSTNESSEQSSTISKTTDSESPSPYKKDGYNDSQDSPTATGTQYTNEQTTVKSVIVDEADSKSENENEKNQIAESTPVPVFKKQENKEADDEVKVEIPQNAVQKENEKNEKAGQWEKKDVEVLGGRTLNFSEENQKMQVEGSNEESKNTEEGAQVPRKPSSKDTTILVFLFVAVVVVGALAFGYNFIKKRKRQSADLERVERTSAIKLSFQNLAKPDIEPEKKPLMSDSKEVEMVNMKNENSTPEQTPETTSNNLSVKT